MFRQSLIFFVLVILKTATIVSAVQCHSSNCSIALNPAIDYIDTTNCTYSVDDACITTLMINLVSSEGILSTTPVSADSFPVFLLNGRAQESLITTLWFRKKLITHALTYICTTGTFCGEDRAQEIFRQSKMLNIDSVWNNLTESLHITSTNNNSTCMNERNQAVTCNNGVCQVAVSSDSSVIARRCISPRGTTDSTGLVIMTSNAASLHLQSSIVYSCNKDRCNDDVTVNRVKQILMGSKLFTTTNITVISGGAADQLSCSGHHTFIRLLISVVVVLIVSF